jgi:hypothetical protein
MNKVLKRKRQENNRLARQESKKNGFQISLSRLAT